jgi:parallel beta-helix repeat protein
MNVHHTWENGIIVKGDYGIVENCKVWQCAFSNSINPGSPSAGYWSSGLSAARSKVDGITTGAILRGNIVFDNWGEGLSSFESEGTLIEDNIVYDNWSVNLYISDTRDNLVQRNIVYNTPNNIVKQRRPFTLGDERIDKPRSANNVIINNCIYNADFWAFWSTVVPGSGLDNVLIANNTIINGQLEIGASIADQAFNKSAIISNNIFSNENDDPWDIKGPLTNLTFSHNLWSVSPPKGLTGAGDVVTKPLLAKTGSTNAGELTADYFKPLETSPAIDKAYVLKDVFEDFFRNLRGSKPDIGAIEYNPSTNSSDNRNVDSNDTEPQITISNSILTIQLNVEAMYKSIVLYNSLGLAVFSHNLASQIYITDVSFLAPGIYIILLSGKNKKKEIKVAIY